MAFGFILLLLLLIAALVWTFKFLLPEKRVPYLSPFMRKLRDFLTMKHLYLEKILRTLYVLSSVITFVLTMGMGILMPFMIPDMNFGLRLLALLGGIIGGAITSVISLFFTRILYENIMLKVMLTDAAKKINAKMGGDGEERSYEEPQRRLAPPSRPRPVVCRRCGTRFDPRRGYCPNCDERY